MQQVGEGTRRNICVNTLLKHQWGVSDIQCSIFQWLLPCFMSAVMDDHCWPLGCKWERTPASVRGFTSPLSTCGGRIHPRQTPGSSYTQMVVFCCEICSLQQQFKFAGLVALFRMLNYADGHLKLMTCCMLTLFRDYLMVIIKDIIIHKHWLHREVHFLRLLNTKKAALQKSENYHWAHLFPI